MKLAPLLILLAATSAARAQDGSDSPYIDAIRKQLPEQEGESSESYTEREKKRIQEADQSRSEEQGPQGSEGYTETIRKRLKQSESGEGYTESEKSKLGPTTNGGAIQAVRDGKSELKMKREGDIHHAIGFKVGAAINYAIEADSGFQAQSFENVYGGGWAPDLSAFYEWQPFHSEIFGNFGLVFNGGVSYFTGKGKFQVELTGFPIESRTSFTFAALPITVGANYRFNLFRVLRPYVFAGPSFIPYVESRSDAQKDKFGYSTGLMFAGGVSILLDFFQREAWDLYESWDVKHYYLTVEYHRTTPITGGVNFSNSGFTAGMTFEY